MQRVVRDTITLLQDPTSSSEVIFSFSERTGGFSQPPYASLNLGFATDDDLGLVEKNLNLVLTNLGLADKRYRRHMIIPHQTHSDTVVIISQAELKNEAQMHNVPEASYLDTYIARKQDEAKEGADAIVCDIAGAPAMIVTADCIPVILVSRRAYAVIHSGWRGTIARISEKAYNALREMTSNDEISAYIGPGIGASDYEVSAELAATFKNAFDTQIVTQDNHLSLKDAIIETLVGAGMDPHKIACEDPSTASHTDRFFSHRKEAGLTGRQAAIACIKEG